MNKTLIKRFVAYLKGVEKVENQKDFALKIGYKSESAFSQAIAKEPIPEELTIKIKKVYPEFNSWANGNLPAEIEIQENINFEDLGIEEKLNLLYQQNLELKEENENIKDILDEMSLTMEISLAPILRHFKLKVDNKQNAQKNSSIS